MAIIIILIGIISSLATKNFAPVIMGLITAVIIHEAMLYDLHKHILFLEDKLNG